MSQARIEAARKMKKDLEGKIRKYKVEGLGEGGKPLIVCVSGVTNKELQQIYDTEKLIEKLALSIDLRACDEDGNRLFAGEKTDILHSFPTRLLRQLANKINEDINDPDFINGSDLVSTVDEYDVAKN